jgi:hypothetical protein
VEADSRSAHTTASTPFPCGLPPKLSSRGATALHPPGNSGGQREPAARRDYYRKRLGPERFEIFQEIFNRMEAAVLERELPWVPFLKRAYMCFSRPGPYNCCGINVRTEGPLRFWIRVPSLEELRELGYDVPDLYPQLHSDCDSHNKLWCWDVTTRMRSRTLVRPLSSRVSITRAPVR